MSTPRGRPAKFRQAYRKAVQLLGSQVPMSSDEIEGLFTFALACRVLLGGKH